MAVAYVASYLACACFSSPAVRLGNLHTHTHTHVSLHFLPAAPSLSLSWPMDDFTRCQIALFICQEFKLLWLMVPSPARILRATWLLSVGRQVVMIDDQLVSIRCSHSSVEGRQVCLSSNQSESQGYASHNVRKESAVLLYEPAIRRTFFLLTQDQFQIFSFSQFSLCRVNTYKEKSVYSTCCLVHSSIFWQLRSAAATIVTASVWSDV